MLDQQNNPALLPNLVGAHLPPTALNVSAEFQFCVDAGRSAAIDFFDDLAAIGLHDHIALALSGFVSSIRAAIVAGEIPTLISMQACTDAFAAGYLGRIQQELRLFHGDQPFSVHQAAFASFTLN